jgi:hypothetical protein
VILSELTVEQWAMAAYTGITIRGEMTMTVTSNEARNEMKVMIVCDLAAICDKVAENSAVPDDLRATARGLVMEFEALLPTRGRGNPAEHSAGEALLIRMARFLPRLIEVQSWPADSSRL